MLAQFEKDIYPGRGVGVEQGKRPFQVCGGVGERHASGGIRGGRPAVADGRGPQGGIGVGDGDGVQVGGKFGWVRYTAGGVLLLQRAGQAQMQPGACVGGEPGRQYLAKQIVGKAEPGLGPDDDPRGSGLFQMSLDRNAKGVLQEARAQDEGIEGRRCQRAHAVLREPGQAPLDDVPDGVRARRRQPGCARYATDSGKAGKFSHEQRVARGALPHPLGLVLARHPAQEPGHQLGNIGRAESAQGDEVGRSG